MARNRPCGVCGKWFRPDPRPGERQHTCGKPGCRREWHPLAPVSPIGTMRFDESGSETGFPFGYLTPTGSAWAVVWEL